MTPVERADMRERAKVLFLQGKSVTQIARELGVSRTMVWHWRAADRWDEEFARLSSSEYEQLRVQAVQNRLATLRELMDVLRMQTQILAERAEEARDVSLIALVKMIDAIAELVAREEARVAEAARKVGAGEGPVEVEWQT